jgi:hypothetical protein
MVIKDGCQMRGVIVEQQPAWAEDRATVGTDPSADPGAKTQRRAMNSFVARLLRIPFGIGTKAINPSRRSRESWNLQSPGDGLPGRYNSARRKLQFTLNHYRWVLTLLCS